MHVRTALRAAMAFVLLQLVYTNALAVPVGISASNLPTCDPLVHVKDPAHELGDADPGPFPLEEAILTDVPSAGGPSACPSTDTGAPNTLVTITNVSSFDYAHLYFVSDAEFNGLFTNVDGIINGGHAFAIDSVGANKPLIFESMLVDNIFQAGETWTFVVDDWTGPPLGAFASIGVGTASDGVPGSAASIVSVTVPEPAGIALLGFGLVAMRAGRKRRCRQLRWVKDPI